MKLYHDNEDYPIPTTLGRAFEALVAVMVVASPLAASIILGLLR